MYVVPSCQLHVVDPTQLAVSTNGFTCKIMETGGQIVADLYCTEATRPAARRWIVTFLAACAAARGIPFAA